MVNTFKIISIKKTLLTMLIFSIFLSTFGYGMFAFAEDGELSKEGNSEINRANEWATITLDKPECGMITFENFLKESESKGNALTETNIAEKNGYMLFSRKLTDSEKEKAEKDRAYWKDRKFNESAEFSRGEDVLIKISGDEAQELKSVKIKSNNSNEVNLLVKDKKKADGEEYFLKLKAKKNINISVEFSKKKKQGNDKSNIDEPNQRVSDREKKDGRFSKEDNANVEKSQENDEKGRDITFDDKVAMEISKPFDFRRMMAGSSSGTVTSARQISLGGGSITWSFRVDDGKGEMNGACVDPTNMTIPLRGQTVKMEKLDKNSHLCKLAYLAKDEFTTDQQQYAVGRAGSRILGYVGYNRGYILPNLVNSLYDRAKSVIVPDGFEAYIARPTNGGQFILTWRYSPGGYLGVHKTSALPNITNGNRCYSLKGAEYGVYKSRSLSGDSRVDTLVTDSNGRAISKRLDYGTYYVAEIKASKGYEIDKTVYTINVDSGRTTIASANVAAVKEVPENYHSILEITKLWHGAKTPTIPSLEGTQFTIKYYDGFYTENNLPSEAVRTWVVESKKIGDTYVAQLCDEDLIRTASDLLYRNEFNAPVIPYGTVSIQETKPAFGYTLEGVLRDTHGNTVPTTKPYVTQVTKENGIVKLQGSNKYSASNFPLLGSIKIKKVKENEKSPIVGAKFQLKNSKGRVVKVADTNSEGEIIFDKLYPDRYTVTELKSAEGYTLLKEPLVIDVPTKLTKAEIDSKGYVTGEFKYNERDKMYYKYDVSVDVINNKPFPVPSTGKKPNNYPAMFGGLLMVGGLLVSDNIRRKDGALETR